MELKGKIDASALLDAIKYIAEHRSTGVLSVTKPRQKIEIAFLEGAILRVDNLHRSNKMRLGALLRRAGFVSPDQIAYALSAQKETLQRIGRILNERFGIEARLVEEFVRLQNSDGFFAVLLWSRGEFEFTPKEVSVAWDRTEPIPTEYLLSEASQFASDWEEIAASRPKSHAGFAQAKPFPVVDDGALGADARRLFEAFETARTYDSALCRSRLGEYRGARAVRTLLAEAYIAPSKPEKDFKGSWIKRFFDRLKPLQVLGAAIVYWFIILGFASLFLLADLSWYGVPWNGVSRYQAKPVPSYLWTQSTQILRRALTVYKLRHGSYPETLDALSKDWIIGPKFLKRPDLPAAVYWTDGKKYHLSMAPPGLKNGNK